MFWKKKKQATKASVLESPEVAKDINNKVSDIERIKKEAAIAKLAIKHSVTSIDWLMAAVKALLEAHPEAKDNLVLIDYKKRYEEYKAELEEVTNGSKK